ncbi:MAG: hypothetical protein NUV69_00120 [Candidatus Curtissbacteria bacterium]|nr:hypothetical protein [Candidatus Curtissbacteria bacterium]
MDKGPANVVKNVLEIVGYEGDKDRFAEEFLILCEDKVLGEMTSSMPNDKKEELAKKLSAETDPVKTLSILREYIDPEEYKRRLKSVSEEIFAAYFRQVMPSLSTDQKKQIEGYMKSFNNTPA